MTTAFKLKAPAPYERELHEAVAQLLARIVSPPAEWAFYPAGAIQLRGDQIAKLARMGLRRGWPDFVILHHKIFGLELKREGGRLSRSRIGYTKHGTPRIYEGQVDVFPRLEAAGMRIEVCRSTDEVIAALKKWGIPLRGVISV